MHKLRIVPICIRHYEILVCATIFVHRCEIFSSEDGESINQKIILSQ